MNIDHYDFDTACYGEAHKAKCLGASYYITATDKMFNDCPLWPGKTAKLIVACETYEQAEQVWENMKYKRGNRGYFTYVKFTRALPTYAHSKYAVKVIHYDRAMAFH